MTSKELLGTSYYAVNSEVTMKIPVAESYLPVQNIKAPNQDLSKDLVYSNDVRNAHFEMKLTCSDGLNETQEKFLFDKDTMNSFFQQIERIQDEMNSYM